MSIVQNGNVVAQPILRLNGCAGRMRQRTQADGNSAGHGLIILLIQIP
jgi:hypothetical protein